MFDAMLQGVFKALNGALSGKRGVSRERSAGGFEEIVFSLSLTYISYATLRLISRIICEATEDFNFDFGGQHSLEGH